MVKWKINSKDPERLLIFQTAFLGDLVLTLPLVRSLRRRWPNVSMTVVARADAARLLEGEDTIDQIIPFAKRKLDKGFLGSVRLARFLRNHRYDLALIPHRSFRSAWITMFSKIPVRIGYSGLVGSALYTHRVMRDMNLHEVQRILDILGPLKVEAIPDKPWINVTRDDKTVIKSWLKDKELQEGNFITFSPGSIWETKRWPENHWKQLADRCVNGGKSIVIIGGPDDSKLAQRISAVNKMIISAAGDFPPRLSAEIIRMSSLLVTGDTAPLHLAGAVGTPVIAIFGPTVPEFGFAPTGEQDKIIGLDIDCRPCAIHGGDKCPLLHHNCMKKISAEIVYSSMKSFL